MPTKKYKMCICTHKDEIVAGPYVVEADSVEEARELAWDLAIGCDLYADEIVDPGKPDLMNTLALTVAEELVADTVEENIEILRSLETEGVITQELYDYILANWDRLVL